MSPHPSNKETVGGGIMVSYTEHASNAKLHSNAATILYDAKLNPGA